MPALVNLAQGAFGRHELLRKSVDHVVREVRTLAQPDSHGFDLGGSFEQAQNAVNGAPGVLHAVDVIQDRERQLPAGIGLLACGNVLNGGDDGGPLAALIQGEGDGQPHPHHMPIPMQIAGLPLVGSALPGFQFIPQGRVQGKFVAMDECLLRAGSRTPLW